MDSILIAGGSCAGLSAARELRKRGFNGSIRIIERETNGPYRRPEVSKGLLDQSHDPASVAIPWPAELALDLDLGTTLEGLDVADRRVDVRDAAGRTAALHYDGLVIATGCEARPSPFAAGIGKVHTLRSVADSLAMRPDLHAARHVVIIGAGFIGLEAASVARKLSKRVTVVESLDVPLARVLGAKFGAFLADLHHERGVRFHTGATVAGLETDAANDVTAAVLSDGQRIPADVVLVAIGSKPGTGWLASSGLTFDDGLVCDETCAVVGAQDVVAAGDVASWTNPLYGRRMRVEHWTNAIEQGGYAARRLLGLHQEGGFVSAPYFWSDQYGLKLQSIGSTHGHDETIVLEQEGHRLLVIYGRQGRLIGAVGLDAGTAVMQLRRQVLRGACLSDLRPAGLTPN